ncbi:MAG: hypothetical protein WKF85_07025 [Chitinophagaceae bacterium]
MENKYVTIQDVNRLRKIFKEKNWINFPNEDSVFNNFCHLLNNLADEQKQLIHELTEKYLWISSNDYANRFNTILNNIDDNYLLTCRKIYLFPVIKPEDEPNIKSGKHCIYIFKGLFALNPKFSDINIEIIEDFESLKSIVFKNDGSELIFLIDDFIGSGETFTATLDEAKKNQTLSEKFILVLSLVIQLDALNVIKNKYGLFTLYSELGKKGITDEYESPEKEQKIKVMEQIEKYIKPNFFSFGYERCEALVTMIRTPDNTFPFFWMKSKINGIEFLPPFPRN